MTRPTLLSSWSRTAACMLLLLAIGPFFSAHAQETPPPGEANARAAILDSPQWRRAMFEVNEWFRTQQIYTPAQVEQVRIEFQNRIANSTAAELAAILGDLQTKLAMLDSPQAREARAWMSEYVAVMSDRKREQVLGDLPNLAQLTSQQLHDELLRIKRKRATMDQRQSAVGRSQAGQVALQSQRHAQSQQAANRPRPAASHSPYRPASNKNNRLNEAPANRPSFFVNPLGGIGRALPGAW